MRRVFMFPGQSSAAPAAVGRALEAHPAAGAVAERARAVLGCAALAPYLDRSGARLTSNRDVQLTVFLATQMYLAALEEEEIHCDASLGLSLGEYSHLVDIGALGFADALRLVDERGRHYDQSPPGTMLTVLAVDHGTVAEVVEQARAHGEIAISNYNAPSQHVIAGDPEAVRWAADQLEREHGAHTTVIERRVPMHSPLMREVADRFGQVLARAPWQRPTKPYVPNVTATPESEPEPGAIARLLTRHVCEPVQWRSSIDMLSATHGDAVFVEVGPGGVLHNMLGRAWKRLGRTRVDAPDDAPPAEHFLKTIEALRA
jgi:[acyl-carrier-protein] S-malonyltransferase